MAKQETYMLSPADTLTLNVSEPAIITVSTEYDKVKIFDRVEAQTIEGLRKELQQKNRLIGELRRELHQYTDNF